MHYYGMVLLLGVGFYIIALFRVSINLFDIVDDW